MATEYKGLTIKFGADTKNFNKALREAKNSAKGVTTELKLVEQGLKIDPKNTELLATKQEAYRKKIEATRKELEAYRQLEKEASTQNDGKGLTDQQWTRLKSDIAKTTAELKIYEKALQDAQIAQLAQNSALNGAGTALITVGSKLDTIGTKASSIGGTLTRSISVPIAMAGSATVVAATKIDTSLTNVKKTVDGTTEDYENLKKAAIEFSQTNAVSASQILDVESLGAQLGYTLDVMSNGKTQVQEFGEVVSGLDIATNMDAETAGSELAQFFNIMQIGKEQTENYASAIVDLGNKNATTESSISAMSLRIAGAGKQIGLSGADVLGLATALTSLGIEAEMGGTAISTIMSNIDKSVALNNDNLKTWASTAGMTTTEFAAAWKEKPVDALNAVLQGMNGAVEEGGNMAVMLDELGISSLRQTDVMKRLAGSGDVLSRAIEIGNNAWKENTALSDEVGNRNDSLSAKFEMLKNRVIAVAEEIGRPLADALLSAVDAAQPLFEAIASGAKTFSEMSEGEQQAIIQTVALVAAAGPLIKVLGTISSTSSKAFKLLGEGLTSMSKMFAKFNVESAKAPKNLKELRASLQANASASKAQSAAMKESTASIQKGTVAQKAMTVATKAATIASKALGVALNLVKVALPIAVISLAVSGIQKLAEANEKATTRSNNLKNSSENLTKSLHAVKQKAKETDDSLNQNKSGVDNTIKSFSDLREEIDEVIQKQSDFASSQKESWGEINAKSLDVSSIVKDLAILCDAGKLSEDQQRKLNEKVSEYNLLTGDTVSVVDATNGVLSKSIDLLQNDTKEWRLNAESQALQERYKELYTNKLEATEKLTAAQLKRIEAEKAVKEAEDLAAKDSGWAFALNDRKKALEDATQAERDAKTVVDEYSLALENTVTSMSKNRNEYNLTRTALTDYMNQQKLASDGEVTWAESIRNTGVDVDSFVTKLQQAGWSTADLRNIGGENLTALASAFNVSTDEMIRKADELGLNLPESARQAMLGMGSAISSVDVGKIAHNSSISVEEGLAFAGIDPAEVGMEGYSTTIKKSDAPEKADEVSKDAVTNLDKTSDAYTKGSDFSEGYARGISDGTSSVGASARAVANAALEELQKTQASNSPSKKTMALGVDFGEGYTLGIKEEEKSAVKQARQLSLNAQKALKTSAKTTTLLSMQDMKANLTMTAQVSANTQQQRLEKLITANKADNEQLVDAMETNNAKLEQLVTSLTNGSVGVYYDKKLVGALSGDMSKQIGRMGVKETR